MAFCGCSKSQCLWLVSFLCCVFGKERIYNDQPKIFSIDGHLHFKVPRDKNVKFLANGITVNDVDLIPTISAAQNATKLLKSYQLMLSTYNNRMDDLEQRMISGVPFNGTSRNSTTNVNVKIRMRLNRLQRRVNYLQRSLTAFQSLLTLNECAKNPCKNGGSCIDIFNGFICQCQSGWEGPTCESDVNECSRFAGTDLGCQNEASCVNKPGSYECVCQNGWLGLHCSRKTADCSTGGAELCGHGTCIPQNTPAGYKCICDQGWTTDGVHLACSVDVDECKQNHPPCSTNPLVACVNVPGSFFCQHCPPGYTGNGYYCADINECELSYNGGCSMNPRVECINTPGSSKCGPCPPAYQGDGKLCTYQGVCQVNNGGCHMLARCTDNPNIGDSYVQCTCPPGYIGNGIGTRGCLVNPSHQTSCDPNPCIHGSCISNKNGTYKCICQRQFYGIHCEHKGNPCDSNPCLNGGTCQNLAWTFKCNCLDGFEGEQCESQEDACGGNINKSNGTLKYPPDNFVSRGSKSFSCAWVIRTTKDMILNITIKKFHLRDEPCTTEFLQIHDGKGTMSHPFGRFCGNKIPLNGTFLSTHPVIYFWFKGDGRTLGQPELEITWKSQKPFCGGLRTDKRGVITSPGYPGMYPNNRDCYWWFKAPPNKRYYFHFASLNIGNNKDCSKDTIEFLTLEGLLNESKPLLKICNSTMPSPFYLDSPWITVLFHTDSNTNFQGFQLAYEVVSGIPGCGGTFTSNSAILKSVEMTEDSPDELECEYEIKLSKKSRIRLSFLQMNIGKSYPSRDGCQEAHVAIYKGTDTDNLLEKYCGNALPGPYTVFAQDLLVVSLLKKGRSHDWKFKYETICGDRLTDPDGSFSSDTPMSTCIYEIERPPGNLITLNLILELANTVNSTQGSFVEVRDGDDENATLMGTYRGNQKVRVDSTTNFLWIKMVKTVFEKVMVTYTSTDVGCGGILKEPIGNIQSPIQPSGEYPANKYCRWVLVAPPGQVVQLNWMTFNLEKSHECTYDNIQIFDNSTGLGTGASMGKFCGESKPPVLLSSSNIMTVVFTSDTTVHGDGFLASYTFIKESKLCGGDYFTTAGQIKSPGYPNEYPTNKECEWTITVPSGQQIELNITDFNIEEYSNCRYDYLEVRNGGTSASPIIGKYCGTNIPKLIPSHTNKMYIKFVSDMSRSGHGFRITWSSASTGCGGMLTSPSGSIISPHYPKPYGINADCLWKISVSAGSKIQVVFADLELEKHNICAMDYVELFDGPKRNSKSLGKFCNPPVAPITTSGNHLMVRFRSDVSFQGQGFNLQYSTVCQNILTGFRGVIESPNFPNDYPQDQSCLWDIIVPQKNKINITFSHFALERSTTGTGNNCSFDYVEIDYLTDTNEFENTEVYAKYGRYCGDSNPGIITINSNHARIHFVSDSLLLGAGFRMEWVIFGCGGILTHSEGEIMSPNYPKTYPASIHCDWLIKAPLGKSIEITFKEIDVERAPECNYDYIQIFNGEDDGYNSLAKFCHQTKPITLTSTGNALFIQFRADYSYQGRGFTANYTTLDTGCGGVMTAAEGNIFSPNYPKNYNKNETCEWLLDTDENHVIELTFTDVDLLSPPLATCDKNHVKVFDGPTQAYPALETVCGTTKPNKTIVSTFNHMFVEFISHNVFTSKGFMAAYKKSCGARIKTSGSGTIQLAKDYDVSDRNCSWIIEAEDPAKHIHLTISHISLEAFEMWCSDSESYVYVYNGPFSNSPLLGSYCHKVPPLLVSDGSSMRIDITTNMDFFATYSVYENECGASLTSLEGFIASPEYPKKYPSNVQCEWTIHVSPGNTFSLNFEKFDLPESENCNTDYLEIRKENASGALIGVFCGKNQPQNATHIGSIWMMLKTSSLESGDSNTGDVKGFYLQYVSNAENKLSGPRGIITNPLYPRGFRDSSRQCTWTVTVATRKKILITFKELFIGTDQVDDECYLSSLKIYDGFDDEAPNLRTVCGPELPPPMITSSNVVYIVAEYFTSRLESLFKLEWEEVSADYQIKTHNTTLGCSESVVVNETYQLKSPGYPVGYAANLNCEWILSTIPMNHLDISFTVIDLHRYAFSRTCSGDVIEIYKKTVTSTDWEKITSICGLPDEEQSFKGTHLIKVVFKTNQVFNKTGFAAEVREECGGSLTETSGYIIHNSSKFTPYEKGAFRCQWNITARSGKTIQLEFEAFDLGPNVTAGCQNYLMLRNGQSSDSPFLGNGKYCGSEIPTTTPLQTTSNHLYLEYKGYTTIGKKGFKLRYQEVGYQCGGEIILDRFFNSTEISSPNFPNIPPPHTECIWRVRVSPGETIRIDFEDRFDLVKANYNDVCVFEYLEIRDGGTDLSPPIGKYCGDDIPNTQFSTDNIMFIKYFTDVDDPRNGFKAKVSIGICGGTIWNEGELESPQTVGFEKTLNCTWHLKAESGHYLTINFTEINTRSSKNCSDDINKIILTQYDPYFKNETTLGVYCGKNLPEPIISLTNEVRVHYIINAAYTQSFRLKFRASVEECKQTLEQESGVITSPGYPLLQHRDSYCYWQIRVPKGRRITMHVDDYDIEPSFKYSFLVIFNGWRMGPKIALSPHIHLDDTFESTDNTAHIMFWSRYGSTKRGFKISFTSDQPTVCQGDFNQTTGVITHPKNYSKQYLCEYAHYNLNKDQTVALTISINTNASFGASCRPGNTRIEVRQINDRLVKNLCGTTTTPVIIRSPYIATKLNIVKMASYYMNFSISYDTFNCGGRIKGETGFIASPNYPNKPSKPYECAWNLATDKGQTIKITLQDLDLGNDCDKHFLAIYNGASVSEPRIGKYCKKNKPDTIITQTNEAFIEYRHEGSENEGKGFNLSYEPVINGCGGIFHDRKRIIQTPNYGKGDYPENAECLWEIRSTPGNFIKLEFLGRFNIEQSINCSKDFVEVWDWRNDDWVSQGRYCGRDVPNEIKSTSTLMKILFRSNAKTNGGGFRAQWNWHCGGSLEATKVPQYIVSPDYPNTYKGGMNCVYNITSKSGTIVNLRFLDFDLERGTPNCQYDNVTISGTIFAKHMRQLGVYCGNNTPPSYRVRKSISIVFKTDVSIYGNGKGFRFMYQDENCGGSITSSTEIKIPDMVHVDRIFQPELVCSWTIIAPKNQIVVFNLKKLTMTSYAIGATCLSQSLQIYNDEEKKENRIMQACSVISDVSVPSNSNKMIINLKTFPYNFRGMEAEVYFTYGPDRGCGGNINLTESITFKSPNNLENLDCQWKITAPRDYQIQMNFTSINVPGHCGSNLTRNFTYVCECAFVDVRDGGGPFSELLAKLCSMSNNWSRSFTTIGNMGFIRLFSWGIQNDVFRVTLTPVLSKCGRSYLNVTEIHKVLTSPNYPNHYPDETKCVWVLNAPQSNRIFLNFESFDLDDLTENQNEIKDCDGQDRLEVIEDPNSPIITEGFGPNAVHASQTRHHLTHLLKTHNRQQFCGKDNQPFHYYSSGNTLALEFNSMPSFLPNTKGKGFKLTYGLAGCDLNLTADNGRVSNYGIRNNKKDCTITITVPENRTISIYFNYFYSFLRNNCTDSGLMIKDKDVSGPILLNACGFRVPNPVFSKTNKLYIKVRSENRLTTMYDFLYTSTDKGQGCGGYIYDYTGTITSPLYPNNLKMNNTEDIQCTWELRVPVGHTISLNFSEFDIQGSCTKNKIVVTSYSENESTDHVYCAQDHPAKLTSERHITVTYYSSINNGGLGWKAAFEAVKNDTTATDIFPRRQ